MRPFALISLLLSDSVSALVLKTAVHRPTTRPRTRTIVSDFGEAFCALHIS
jgi:hypothetical protein